MKILVLGGGLVGGAIVRDLVADDDTHVTAVDISSSALERLPNQPRLSKLQADVLQPGKLEALAGEHDLVVGALPGDLGFSSVKRVIDAGRSMVDISFFPEDPFPLDQGARDKGVTVIVDCGVAPGLSYMLYGHVEGKLDEVERFSCLVGGLPVVRTWPWEYKAVFSPIDVLEEYTRPARFRVDGKLVTAPALSDPELIDFPGVGTLESFNTDGLRSLLVTAKAPCMIEKTLRYPGHIDKIRVLRATGLLSKEPVNVGGNDVRPIDLTARLLFPQWHLQPGEEDFTVMRVVVEGKKDGQRLQYCYDLLDRFDRLTGTTSMARTTGYTCTAAVRAFAKGIYTEKGISPPEYLGRQEQCWTFIRADLAKRNVVVRESITDLPSVLFG